jgi:hypothetical protein
MSDSINRSTNVIEKWNAVDLNETSPSRWLCDLDLHERFLTLPDYVQRLQLMRMGIVPLDATLFP